MNGKIGLVAFIDDGRVWLPDENSNKWHVGYGGGLLIAPFNFAFFDVTYGISKESTPIQIRLRKKMQFK
jgi:outer membrane translocation and assembly module TamA